ncbi:uncharacterized protein LOC118436801 [Folsomia candida]|uniref:uncharacterized protein LOC118436801 n=1 Tax=Folsomia candida TaxID=158441 RepID=UPI001604FC9C|nr:uncharacterized protein LOC118436801 [Folsomia candida]
MGEQLRNFLLVAGSIFIVIFIIPLILFFVIFPLILYRKLIIFLASYKKDIYLPLNICSSGLAWDDIYRKPICTLSIVNYLKHGPEISQVTRRLERVVQIHPELTCTLHSWMSILFWKKSPNFKLSQHLTIYKESNPEKIQQYLDSLPEKPFSKGAPLWECISLPNYSNTKYATKSALVLRIHHTVADGLALLSLWNDLFDKNGSGEERIIKNGGTPKNSKWDIWKIFELIFITPTETIFTMLKGIDSNPLTIHRGTGEMVRCQNLVALDMADLKRISRAARTNITSAMFFGVTGAVRRILMERGANLGQDATSIYILPSVLGHQGTSLTNNLTGAPLRMPVSERNLEQRLVNISDQFHHISNSTYLLGMTAFYRSIALISGTLQTELRIPSFGTLVHSNFATFKDNRYELFGNPVERAAPITGVAQRSCLIAMVNISYNGKMGIAITADKAIFPDTGELERVINGVISEIKQIGEARVHRE